MLEKLRAIRDAMKEEGGNLSSSAESEALLAENASLKTQLEKKNYRIMHLVQSLQELTGTLE